MSTAKMTSKGRITLRAELRARLSLKAGDMMDLVVNPRDELLLRPRIADVRSLRGLIAYEGAPVTIEDMNEAISGGIAETFEPSLS
jgi:AbrB family looped-hinge helix DNA binding protein